ncbi:MAG: toxin-activating lysine-acyltransferase [Candidatus Sphingomonas phytovorans]|nr:toxin-activating lysine-acyltransferase [Sphingomonas sp.]WEK00988.1 MAG: toxin-activating lysine-acyltransferase [Sphingomonas sp.]
MDDALKSTQSASPVKVSQAFGEIAWLISQSKLHHDLRVADLGWFVMPPILHRQFHLFRDGERPVGVALWAMVNDAVEQKIIDGFDMSGSRMSDADWISGDQLWLVDLIAPFSTVENRHREVMFGDLISGRFSGQSFKMVRVDLGSGSKDVVTVPADAGERLTQELRQNLAGGSAK